MMFELAPFGLPDGYAESILSLADVKQHLRVDGDDEDDLIGAFRDAAVDAVEKYTGLILGPRTGAHALVWRAERLCPPVRLGVRPVTSLVAFRYLDRAGDQQPGDVATLRIGTGSEVVLKGGASWPSDLAAGVEIEFEAGLPAGKVPASLVQAARMFTAHLYLNREAVAATGNVGGELPLGFRSLCSAYRQVVI